MSTKCMIGIQNKDKSIDAVYCHNDGQPAAIGQILIFYDEESLKKILSKGDMSSLDRNPDECDFYEEKEPYDSLEEWEESKIKRTSHHYESLDEYVTEGDDHDFHYYLSWPDRKWKVIDMYWDADLKHFTATYKDVYDLAECLDNGIFDEREE